MNGRTKKRVCEGFFGFLYFALFIFSLIFVVKCFIGKNGTVVYPGGISPQVVSREVNVLKKEFVRLERLIAVQLDAKGSEIILDEFGIVRCWPNEAEKLTGWDKEDVVGKSSGELILKANNKANRLVFCGAIGSTTLTECNLVTKDGREIEVKVLNTVKELDGIRYSVSSLPPSSAFQVIQSEQNDG